MCNVGVASREMVEEVADCRELQAKEAFFLD
jgi:hypothetical protein